jgi:hypothetical protein
VRHRIRRGFDDSGPVNGPACPSLRRIFCARLNSRKAGLSYWLWYLSPRHWRQRRL